MGMDSTEQIGELLEMFTSDDLNERLTAIEVLGEIGDEEALRERMAIVAKEHHALVIAIGKLKRKLGVK